MAKRQTEYQKQQISQGDADGEKCAGERYLCNEVNAILQRTRALLFGRHLLGAIKKTLQLIEDLLSWFGKASLVPSRIDHLHDHDP